MAQIVRKHDIVMVRLTLLERILCLRFRPVSVPFSSVRQIRTVDDPWTQVRGVAPIPAQIRDRVAVGTRRGLFGKDFTAVYGSRRGVVVDLDGDRWSRIVVTSDEAEDVAALLRG